MNLSLGCCWDFQCLCVAVVLLWLHNFLMLTNGIWIYGFCRFVARRCCLLLPVWLKMLHKRRPRNEHGQLQFQLQLHNFLCNLDIGSIWSIYAKRDTQNKAFLTSICGFLFYTSNVLISHGIKLPFWPNFRKQISILSMAISGHILHNVGYNLWT